MLSSKLKKEYATDAFIVAYLVVGTIFTLLLGRKFFNVPANSLPLIYILFGAVAYVGFYSIYLVLTGSLSGKLRNFVFTFYSSVIGVFLGLSLSASSAIAVALALSLVDMFWVYRRLGRVEDRFERFMVVSASSAGRWGIGLGDLTCYAMLVTCAFVSFGLATCVISTLLILLGSVSSMKGAERYTIFPGLPLSVGLGTIPILLNLAMTI